MKLKKAFKEIEDMMVRNISRSIVELEMHLYMTDEELLNYYELIEGNNIKEEERKNLIEDTLRNIRGDVQKLNFYQENKKQIIDTYGKDEIRDISGIAEQHASESLRVRSYSEYAGNGSGQEKDTQGGNGSENNANETSDLGGDIIEEQRSAGGHGENAEISGHTNSKPKKTFDEILTLANTAKAKEDEDRFYKMISDTVHADAKREYKIKLEEEKLVHEDGHLHIMIPIFDDAHDEKIDYIEENLGAIFKMLPTIDGFTQEAIIIPYDHKNKLLEKKLGFKG